MVFQLRDEVVQVSNVLVAVGVLLSALFYHCFKRRLDRRKVSYYN